jgi:serine/threonine-protein kinase
MTDELKITEIVSGNLIDNRYLVRELLGEGAIGRTYLALDTHRFNEPCVLKECAPSGRGKLHLQKSQELFKTEAKILLQLQHPQIPKLLACFEKEEKLFLVQEYISGKTYTQLLKERQQQGRTFLEAEVIKLAIDLLPVLIYIHACGVVHRDISPDNIIQPGENKPPVLIDFGVGKLVIFDNEEEEQPSNSPKSSTGTMSFVGKMGYAPHEQISMGICSPASDLYALGVTSIVLLTGRQPISLIARDTLEWQWRSYTDVSESFAQIIEKLLADRPKNRYQSAQELLNDLKQLRPSQKTIIFSTETDDRTQELPNYWDRQSEESTNPPPIQQKVEQSFFYSSDLTEPISSEEVPARSTPISDLRYSDLPREKPLSEPSTEIQSNNDFERFDPSISRIEPTIPSQSFSQLDPRFIEACQERLALYIGPMAILIIEEQLDQNPSILPQELVAILAKEIPDYQQAQEFRHSF